MVRFEILIYRRDENSSRYVFGKYFSLVKVISTILNYSSSVVLRGGRGQELDSKEKTEADRLQFSINIFLRIIPIILKFILKYLENFIYCLVTE